MPRIFSPNKEKILPKYQAMTPYQIYVAQVKGAIEALRASAKGLDYIPPQLGGLSGQRAVIDQEVVLEIIEFEIN
jgi:hypothetical protein